MIPYPPVGPLWGSEIPARAEILGGRAFCRPFLGLRDPGGRRLKSTQIAAHRATAMIHEATVGPVWGSEIQPEPRSWLETSGEQ